MKSGWESLIQDLGGRVLKSVKTENSRADFASIIFRTEALNIGDSIDIRHWIEIAPLINKISEENSWWWRGTHPLVVTISTFRCHNENLISAEILVEIAPITSVFTRKPEANEICYNKSPWQPSPWQLPHHWPAGSPLTST